jgi:hypothetical protein
MHSPINEDAVVEEHGTCVCTGCIGFFRRCRNGEGELILVCSTCSLAFEEHEED